jgi:hypothetical protein
MMALTQSMNRCFEFFRDYWEAVDDTASGIVKPKTRTTWLNLISPSVQPRVKFLLSGARFNGSMDGVLLPDGRQPDPPSKSIALQPASPASASSTVLVKDIIPIFIARHMEGKKRAPTYIVNTRRLFELYVIPFWGERDIRTIRRSDVGVLIERLVDAGKPVQANRLLSAVRKLLNWSLNRGLLDVSPVAKMEAPSGENQRSRVLTPDELRLIWIASDQLDFPYGPIVRLLMLTLQRRNEVAHVAWREFGNIDDAIWVLPGARAKNGQPNTVPLSAQALGILRGLSCDGSEACAFAIDGMLPRGFSNIKRKLDEAIISVKVRDAQAMHAAADAAEPMAH